MITACPPCGSKNRVPDTVATVRCGRCRHEWVCFRSTCSRASRQTKPPATSPPAPTAPHAPLRPGPVALFVRNLVVLACFVAGFWVVVCGLASFAPQPQQATVSSKRKSWST